MKFHVIEDYSEDTTVIMGMASHAWVDGLTMISVFRMLSTDYDPN